MWTLKRNKLDRLSESHILTEWALIQMFILLNQKSNHLKKSERESLLYVRSDLEMDLEDSGSCSKLLIETETTQ